MHIQTLLVSAQNRKTNQGIKIYKLALEQLNMAESDGEVLDVLSRLKAALKGIESHGFFTFNESKVVAEIQTLP